MRLLQILPDLSNDGKIKCHMQHAILPLRSDSKRRPRTLPTHETGLLYSCLSYTWGNGPRDKTIRINDKLYAVHQNLWDFLDTARIRISADGGLEYPHATYEQRRILQCPLFWIDALCIDQDDVLEKNHQVQQMGRIYATAYLVMIWLGRKAVVEVLVRGISSKDYGRGLPGGYDTLLRSFIEFSHLEYWSRAWITQEVVLARYPLLYTSSGAHDLLFLSCKLSGLAALTSGKVGKFFTQFVASFRTGCQFTSVVPLLENFGTKRHCTDIRDRIYSMLALCGSGPALVVDYDITEEALMRQVLAACKDSVCVCSTAIVAQTLEMFKTEKRSGDSFYVEFDNSGSTCDEYYKLCCFDCMWGSPPIWSTHQGLVLDMGAVCSSAKGHILADAQELALTDTGVTKSQCVITNGHYCREGMPSLPLFNIGISQHLCQKRPSRYCPSIVHTRWRFTFETLLRIAEYEQHSTSQVILCGIASRGFLAPYKEGPRLTLVAVEKPPYYPDAPATGAGNLHLSVGTESNPGAGASDGLFSHER